MNNKSIDAASTSGGTIVPAEFRFTETQYEPSANITSEELSRLSQDDLLTGLKKQYSKTSNSFGQFRRDITILVAFYDEVVRLCKNERVSKNRDGKPTLQQAFFAVGWNYEAARKMKQRYNAVMGALPAYAPTPKPLQLAEGDKVKTKEGDEKNGIVIKADAIAPKVDVVFDGAAEPTTVLTESLKKIFVPRKKVRIGDLILFEDIGTEHKYEGRGKLTRTETPTLLEQKHERELAQIEAKQKRETAKAEEKQRQKEFRRAEAARRDLEKIVAAKAKKEGERQKKEEVVQRRLEKEKAKAAAKAARENAKAAAKVAKQATKLNKVRKHDTTPSPAIHGPRTQGTVVGDKSEPTAHGYHWEFRKHDKTPYVIRDVNHPALGILVECPSKITAEMMINKYEWEAEESGSNKAV